jgi:UTP--glucose-1-phosphate uridylyltransferase
VPIRKAVIPAAGLGTRLLPATKAVPKEMMPIVNKPAIQVIVEECVAAGVELIVLVNGRYKGALEDHFDVSYEVQDVLALQGKSELLDRITHLSEMVDIVSVRQNRPLGLGHAVHCARPVIGDDEPFAVLLPDDLVDAERPAIRQLIDVFEDPSPSRELADPHDGPGVRAVADVFAEPVADEVDEVGLAHHA